MNTDLYALVHKKVIENGYKITNFMRVRATYEDMSGWVFLCVDNDNFIIEEEEFEKVKLSHIILEKPIVRSFLDKSINVEYYWNEDLGAFQVVKQHGLVYKTLDSLGFIEHELGEASDPAKVRISIRNYMYYELLEFPLHFQIYLGLTVLSVVYGNLFSTIFLTVILLLYMGWLLYCDMYLFYKGDTCPAIVLSLKPLVLAAYTDLSKGEGKYPVLKLIKIKNRVKNPIKKVGEIVPTIANYEPSGNKPYWESFNPVPAYYGTSDQKELNRVKKILKDDPIKDLKFLREQFYSDFKLKDYKGFDLIKLKGPDSDWVEEEFANGSEE